MSPWSRQAVLGLYKALLRQGEALQYTDKDFYRRTIQKEFRKQQHDENVAEKERHLKVNVWYWLVGYLKITQVSHTKSL